MGVYSRIVELRSDAEGVSDAENRPISPARSRSDVASLVANVGERIQELLDAAERVAGRIQDDAETAAAEHQQQRRAETDRMIGERIREFDSIGRSLAGSVEGLQREARELIQELDDAARRLSELGGDASPGTEPRPAAVKPSPPPSPQPVAYPGTAARTGVVPEQAVLRATQLAVGGTGRAEIEQMLRSDFGVEDPAPVMDRLLRSEPT